jgi:hypothetical protein
MLRLPDSRQLAHEGGKVSSLRSGFLYLPGDIPCTYFCFRLGRTQGRSATGRIKSMKNPNENIGNRTPKLPDFVKRIINIWFHKANFISNRAPRSAGVQMIGTKAKLSSWSSNSTSEERDGEYPRTRWILCVNCTYRYGGLYYEINLLSLWTEENFHSYSLHISAPVLGRTWTNGYNFKQEIYESNT